MHEKKLELVVSHSALDLLPNELVKIVLGGEGMNIDPRRKIYRYGADATLDISNTQIKISPAESMISIGKKSFYIHTSGLVRITVANGEIQSQHYVNVYKFLNVYRQEKEKDYLKEKTRQWQKEDEQRKKDRY